MPDFTTTLSVEVYCGTCGAGLCGQSTAGEKRGYPIVTVDVCPDCMEAKDDEIHDLNQRIKELEKQIELLEA